MKTYQVTCENGYTYKTPANSSIEEFRKYLIGHIIPTEPYNDAQEECEMSKIINVEQLI